MSEKLFWGVKDVSVYLGLSKRTIWRMAYTGEMPNPFKIGGSVRWKRDEILAWIANQTPYTPETTNKKGRPRR